MVEGHPVTFVASEDGSGGLLSDYLVMDDRRATVRPPDDAFKFIWNIPNYMAQKKEAQFLGMVKTNYSEAPITERERRLFELGYIMGISHVRECLRKHAQVTIKSYPDFPAPPKRAE